MSGGQSFNELHSDGRGEMVLLEDASLKKQMVAALLENAAGAVRPQGCHMARCYDRCAASTICSDNLFAGRISVPADQDSVLTTEL